MDKLLQDIRNCQLCAKSLQHKPRPVVQANPSAKILIIGQAPGARVQESGIPFDDASGNRLRDWMGIDKETFYDSSQLAIMPMGFCYPGKGKSGDLPPRPECAPKWHQLLLTQMPNIQLTLLIGQYAQKYYLGDKHLSLTERVKNWQAYQTQYPIPYFVLPHPSPRNQIWLKKNPWFELDVVENLRSNITAILG